MALELFQFQQAAASEMADRFVDYHNQPIRMGRGNKLRSVPFYQALSAITGAGKTAILAQAVSEISALMEVPPVVLWLSKGKVVVQQSYANLANGGRYNHLLPNTTVRLLSEYNAEDVAQSDETLLYFATVGTFNQRDRAASKLKIFAADTDNVEATRWEALKVRETAAGARRPLLVIYDEAQNLSDQQTLLLLEQEPAVFLLASATLRFPARFHSDVIEPLRGVGDYTDDGLITRVPTAEVQASGLVKGIVALDGLHAPMEETIAVMLADMADANGAAHTEGLDFSPKAIYVCNTNVVASDAMVSDDPAQPFNQRQAPPILIWRYLTETCAIPAEEVAVYADLKTHRDFPLPPDFTLFSGGDRDYADFTAGNYRHIIFNKTLQEGWDDPRVYFAYVDKSMDSEVQISQIIGRVLRQPDATHYAADRLNTAHFYVRVDRNDSFASVLEDVRRGLGGETPEVRILATPPGAAQPVSLPVKEVATVPKAAIDNSACVLPIERMLARVHDYSHDVVNTTGVGRRRTVHQVIGHTEADDTDWVDFEQTNRVNARWVFRREVSRRYKPALFVMDTHSGKFDAKVGVGSNAYQAISDDAARAVDEYLRHAIVKQQRPKPYLLGDTLVRTADMETFRHALHEGYDGLNDLELRFARAIDETGLRWARNRTQTGYRIPLVTLGPTVWFFPDFLVWSGDTVYCVDTKNHALVEGDARRKLLTIKPHVDVATTVEVRFVTEGTWKSDGTLDSRDGYSLWGLGSGQQLRTDAYEDLASVVKSFLASSAG